MKSHFDRSSKDFDCVEMMHHGQTKRKKRLEGKTDEEILAYYKLRAEEVSKEQELLKAGSVG